MDVTDERIVSFAGYQRDMRFPVISEVQAYWEALRAGRLVPLRSEVDPRGIERALEYAFVLERVAPQVSRFRLAGMHLNDLMGMEVRGMPFTSFFTPALRARVSEVMERVFSGPEVVELKLVGETGIGRPQLDARLLILPLKSDLGDITRALGCLVSHGQIGRTPRRFEVAEARVTPITAGMPATGTRAPATLVPGLAEAPAAFGAAPARQPQQPLRVRGHLRLVKSDD